MRKIVFSFLSIAAALTLASGAAALSAFGHEKGTLSVEMTSNPRFPVVGQQAELTFRPVFNDGMPNTKLEPMVMLDWTAAEEHHDGPVSAAGANTTPANGGSMANMPGMAPTTAGAPPEIMLMPVEASPGIYVANVTFVKGGNYIATFSAGEEEYDLNVGVRQSPIAWWYIGALTGLVLVWIVTVAVIKTVRRAW